MEHRSDPVRLLLLSVPALALCGYAWLIKDQYAPFCDWTLECRIAEAVLPEDILGFGFLLTWVFVALVFAFILAASLTGVRRPMKPALLLVTAFAALSVVDHALYRSLAAAVFAKLST